MTLKYYSAYRKTIQAPSNEWKDEFQALVDEEFENAPDYYLIQKENTLGIYEDLYARVTPVYTIQQGYSFKDDYRKLIFPNYADNPIIGERYYFNNFYWICIDTGKTKVSSASCLVQKCADFLRFYDDFGIYYSLPCIINKTGIYDLDTDSIMNLPVNQIRVLVKYENASKMIKWADMTDAINKNTRFILQGYAYRTVSIDRHSFVRSDMGYIDIRMQSDQIRENDDVVNGIADAVNDVSINIIHAATPTLGLAQTMQLNTNVFRNGIEFTPNSITYTSSDNLILTINETGLITPISVGSAIVTATYAMASDNISITILSATDNYTIDFTSSTGIMSTIKLNQQVTFSAKYLNNGTPYTDIGTWSLTDDTGVAPTALASIISQTGDSCKIICVNDADYTKQYFRLYCAGSDVVDYIRLQVKGLF